MWISCASKVFVCIAVLVGLLDAAVAHGRCGTKSQSKQELDLVQRKINDFRKTRSSIGCIRCIAIDTYVYVFQASNGDGSEFNEIRIDEQMQILNAAFAKTPFKFQLIEANYEEDDFYYLNFYNESELANNLSPHSLVEKWPRRGDYTSLNMYFGGYNSGYSFATYPYVWERGTSSDVFPAWDAVYLNSWMTFDVKTLTIVHEVGHWLGLLHVFDSQTGKACDANDKNDYVADTPQLANITYGTFGEGCPSDDTDTCPLLPGNDPIHNYMDYSDDSCTNQFTKGQIDRMYYVWSIYRKKRETCSTGNTRFELELLTDSWPGEIHWSLISTDGTFQWDTRTDENVDWYYDYYANALTTQEICLDTTKNYTFTIYDDSNNGIQVPGYYAIRYGGTQLKRNSAFGGSEATRFVGGFKPRPTLCFSGNSRVHLQDKGWVGMSEVKIGDKVLVASGMYEEVYSFGHRNVAESADFLQIYCNDTVRPVEISADHLILLGSKHWVPAGNVVVGDVLTKGDGSPVAITQLRYVRRKGIYAPFTKSGSIVVNDIVASNYVTFQGSEYLIIGGVETQLSFHWLAHTFESGHRLACNIIACDEETYTASGISNWVFLPHMAGEMLLNQNPMVTALVVFPLILVFGTLSFIELWSAVFAVIMVAVLVLAQTSRSVRVMLEFRKVL